MNGKVVDIEGADKHCGAKVLMFDQKDPENADNQLWFEDRYGNIRSKLNDHLILDASGKLSAFIFIAVRVFFKIVRRVFGKLTKRSNLNIKSAPAPAK